MSPTQPIPETKTKLAAATEHLKAELGKLRTGRAHPSMLDGIMVSAYGQPMMLKAVAGVTTPEATLLQITPFDPANLQAIAEAIRADQALGLNPTDDGHVVRVTLPPLTTESRQAMAKIIGQKLEECLVSARAARHEALHAVEASEKDKQIGKDERFGLEKQIDELVAKQKEEAEALASAKESEIMTI